MTSQQGSSRDRPLDPCADLTIRYFTDQYSRSWEVREIRQHVLPERHGLFVRPEFEGGWLLFSSGEERRRFAPLPPGWRGATQRELRRWCEDAEPVRSTKV